MVLTGLVNDVKIAEVLDGNIGRGSARDIFSYKDEPNWVIKQHRFQPHFSNMIEWIIWNQIKETESLKDIFGECAAMSVSGRYLVMEKLVDLTKVDGPQTLRYPSWLTDRKISNFGRSSSGIIKIRDFGQLVLGDTLARGPLEQIQVFR